jgi:membrane dipeptidase
MPMRLITRALAAGLLGLLGCERLDASHPPSAAVAGPIVDLHARADALAHSFIILDGHVDLPMRVTDVVAQGHAHPDVHLHTDDGDFDWARARAGGLDAPFMSIYTPAAYQDQPGASKQFAEQQIDFVFGLTVDHPDKFALARTPADVRANFARGLISLPMGMENGSPIEAELDNVRHFYQRGIRYVTLTHSRDNLICDSSYDDRHTHAGLSPFGRQVVAELNRWGIMIDVSHVSDAAFWQVIELSAVPVIASHSSCRHFTPGFERNMSDEMIVALAEHGGVIQINFGGGFLTAEFRAAEQQARAEIAELLRAHDIDHDHADARALIEQYVAEHPLPRPSVATVADHIDHVVALVGVDHVGFGSDFDGVGDTLPIGLEDVSKYPALIEQLLARGYAEADIEKICSGNVLRVWQAVEDFAAARRP